MGILTTWPFCFTIFLLMVFDEDREELKEFEVLRDFLCSNSPNRVDELRI